MKKPLYCPCCGGKVEVVENEWHPNYYGAGIFCECGLSLEYDCKGRGRAKRRAIEKWNRRIDSEPSVIPCAKCGGTVVEFIIPNDIWNFVIRKNGKETDQEYLCEKCWFEALRTRLFELEDGKHKAYALTKEESK
jgi:hypothetical protein